MGFLWNLVQGSPWFRPWLPLQLVYGDILGSEIDFEPGGGVVLSGDHLLGRGGREIGWMWGELLFLLWFGFW